jgi:hypothetical protein
MKIDSRRALYLTGACYLVGVACQLLGASHGQTCVALFWTSLGFVFTHGPVIWWGDEDEDNED